MLSFQPKTAPDTPGSSLPQMIEDVQLAALGRVPIVPIGGISHDHSGFGVGPALEPDAMVSRIAELC